MPIFTSPRMRQCAQAIGSGLLELMVISGFSLALAYLLCFWIF